MESFHDSILRETLTLHRAHPEILWKASSRDAGAVTLHQRKTGRKSKKDVDVTKEIERHGGSTKRRRRKKNSNTKSEIDA